MPRYCQNCGKSVPNDAVLCPYCGTQIDYSKAAYVNNNVEQKSSDSTKIVLIVLAVVAVIIVVVILIAASAYFYVSDMMPPPNGSDHEAAAITVKADNNLIELTLAKKGDLYNNGYSDFYIYVNGVLVDELEDVGYWTLGETISIGESYSGYEVNGYSLSSGSYDVTVRILDTVVFMSTIDI